MPAIASVARIAGTARVPRVADVPEIARALVEDHVVVKLADVDAAQPPETEEAARAASLSY